MKYMCSKRIGHKRHVNPFPVIVWLALLLGLSLYVQGVEFKHLSEKDGLSHSSIFSIAQDAFGFMWFGTEYGLNRFDGITIKVMHHEPSNPNSLASSNFGDILIEPSGIMWFGFWGGGVDRYDPQTGMFEHFRHDPENISSLSQDRVELLFMDSRGTLWVGTEEGGLNRFDKTTDTFIHYIHDPDNPASLANNSIKAITEDNEGRLWIGSNFGVSRYDSQTDGFIHYRYSPGNSNSLSGNQVRCLCATKDGMLWVGTRGSGLNRFDPVTGVAKRYLNNPDDPSSISDDSITQVFEDSSGTIWVGTYDGGLNRFEPQSGTFERFMYEPRISCSLSHNRVEVIFEDRSRVLWLGTRGGGISQMDLKPPKFRNYLYNPNLPNSLPHPVVLAIAAEPDGEHLWLGSDGGGISRFSVETGTFNHIRPKPGQTNALLSDRIRVLYFDSKKQLWIGSYTSGLSRMVANPNVGHRFDHYTHDPGSPYTLSNNDIKAIIEDSGGNIWVGTRHGLNLLKLSDDPKNRKFRRFLAIPSKPGTLPGNYVSSIHQDRVGKIWVGTFGGLGLLDEKSGRFTVFRHKENDSQSLSNNNVQVIYEPPDSPGTHELWIGTDEGLNRFTPDTGTFRGYTVADGLVANRIHGILSDERGRLWISTSGGLSCFNPVNEHFRNYGIPDGLPGNGFYRNACVKTKNRRLFFGSAGGVVSFLPLEVKDNPFIPPVVITSIKRFNQDIPFTKPVWMVRELSLPHNENFISFQFAALDFTDPARNRYAYKMEGLNPDWTIIDSRNFVEYANLQPGHYTFRVKGSNNDMLWNHDSVSFELEIRQPFWKTWWFRILVTLILTLAVIMLFRLRVGAIRKRNVQLSRNNERLEEEVRKRKQAEADLLESRGRLHSVINHASIVIWALDKDGIFTFSDGKGLELLGFKPGQVVGQSVFQLYRDYPEILATAQRALAGETVSGIAKIGDITFVTRYTPLKDNDGNVVGAIGVAMDETHRKRAEAEKSMLAEQLRHVQKLETIGTLAGGIAHDFNNILGPILGYTEMALEEIPRDNIAVKWLESVVEASTRAKDLVQQILVFGRRDKQEYKPVLIQIVIKEALKLIRASFPTTMEIHQSIASNCKPVLADPTQIHQVFMNLCTNAKHAMKDRNGRLSVTLKEVDVNPDMAEGNNNLEPGRYVLLTVSDTGCGMGGETLKRLFEPFYTTKKSGEGTGMGLSVVHGIVMGHDGEITVSSQAGEGSEFKVYLPVVDYQLANESVKPQVKFKGKEHILLVDDEESMAVMGKLMLEQLGYHVSVFTDSSLALERFKEKPGAFDIVITDQTMPHLTGIQLTLELKKRRPEIPVIIVSGFSEHVNQDNFHEFGVSAYISKPFNSHSLGRAIRESLESDCHLSRE